MAWALCFIIVIKHVCHNRRININTSIINELNSTYIFSETNQKFNEFPFAIWLLSAKLRKIFLKKCDCPIGEDRLYIIKIEMRMYSFNPIIKIDWTKCENIALTYNIKI